MNSLAAELLDGSYQATAHGRPTGKLVAIPAGRTTMAFQGRCIVVQVTETEWYVAVPPIAQPGPILRGQQAAGAPRGIQSLQGTERAGKDELVGGHAECHAAGTAGLSDYVACGE